MSDEQEFLLISDLFDMGEFEAMVEQGYVNLRKHPLPTVEYVIANYSKKTQFEQLWNNVTEQCRGLIYHEPTGVVVARPWAKFYNLEERRADVRLSRPGYTVTEKMDGSLGILYPQMTTYNFDKMLAGDYYEIGRWAVATRGSFDGEQANWATEWLSKNYDLFYWMPRKGFVLGPSAKTLQYTTLVEIIYPSNRIVVNYDMRKDLTLLDRRHTVSGESDCLEDINFPHKAQVYEIREGAKAKEVAGILNRQAEIAELAGRGDLEGFVVSWPDGFRVKVKFDEYVRLHRIVTGSSLLEEDNMEFRVWELVTSGYSVADILDSVDIPDEIYQELITTEATLRSEHTSRLGQSFEAGRVLRSHMEDTGLSLDEALADMASRDVSNRRIRLLGMEGRGRFKDLEKALWDELKPENKRAIKKDGK